MKTGWTHRAFAASAAWLALVVATPAAADSLSGKIDTLFGPSGITLDVRPINPAFPPHTAHFRSASLQALGLLTTTLSSQAADFPAISTVPGFTYQYDPQLQVFSPQRGSLGSVFVERPETLGQGRVDFGVSYAWVSFKQLNGKDLKDQDFVLSHNDCCGGPNTPDFPAFENDTIDVRFDKFELDSNVVTLFGSYGLTDKLDVNVLLPVVFTSLKLRATAHINDTTNPPIHFFDNAARTVDLTRSIDEDHAGVGDMQLRAKLRLPDVGGLRFATGVSFRMPTGSQDDFQGFGDFTITPFLVTATDVGPINLHASTGFDVDPETASRSRIRYAGGASWQVMERAALILDFVGSSNLKDEKVEFDVPQFSQDGSIIGSQRATQEFRTDVIDIAPGVKVNLFGPVVGFFTAFVPLNDDGLRADFIPTGGIEASF